MLFNSLDFLIFYPVVVLIYFVIPEKTKKIWLLASSYYFYMCWSARYALLILTSTAVTYACGLMLEKADSIGDNSDRHRKEILIIGLVINFGILFVFKYLNFSLAISSRILSVFGIKFVAPEFDIVLPVGISFYTFQAVGYVIDVYRRDIKAENNFIQYALFVSFFPQLVAGPIERSKNLLGQLKISHRFDFDNLREGLLLILWGYFLKIVIADRLALFVDTAYADIETYPGVFLLVATVFFSIQIYCDFYGYSTIAVGTAKILGINLMDNFRQPYLSTSVTEFWRKWHISLNSWFRDYLYIPLGGNRKGKIRKYINTIIVFAVSGLWHGARLTFVAWGLLNGFFIVTEELLSSDKLRINRVLLPYRNQAGVKFIKTVFTFVLICITMIFFRSYSIVDSLGVLKSIFTVYNPWKLFDTSIYYCGLDMSNYWLVIAGIGLLMAVGILNKKKIYVRHVVMRQNSVIQCVFIAVAICLILLLGKYGPAFDKASFIYFQF